MSSSRDEPVCCFVASVMNECFTEKSSLKDYNGDWQELEQSWGEQNERLSTGDEHVRRDLNNDDWGGAAATNDSKEIAISNMVSKMVKGSEIKDIPTTYALGGLRPRELIVIGTYVDENIIPGFRYKVRKNLSEDYLFAGKALYLETIGLGYGKRLTFQGDSLNQNDNYFWSDSHDNGYGFTLQTISPVNGFNILDTVTGQEIGRVIINNPSLSDDREISSVVHDHGRIQKEVQVHFSCDVILKDCSIQQNIFVEDVVTHGVAEVVRKGYSTRAVIERIILQDFIVEGCHLLPED